MSLFGGRERFRLRRRRRRRCTGFFRGRGRPRYVSLFGGQGHGERGRFRLRLRKRCHYTGFFRGRGRPRYVSIFGGRGRLGGRGRPPHTSIGIFEVGGGPGFVADDPFGDAEQIYSDILVIRLKARAAQVGGCDLQGIEQQAGGFGVHLAADDHAHDLPESDLDGVGVLEHGQNKLGCDVMGGVAEVNSGHAPATMEVAIGKYPLTSSRRYGLGKSWIKKSYR